MPVQRLQKIIAAAGLASRRKAEELIQAGLVSVNGQIVTELGSKADPEHDSIRVNNKPLKGPERHEYIALNKPKGYVTTVSDPEGRATVMELVRSKSRVYPIGRLDFNSEGLLLLTNDGELAHKLMKAASHIPKTYLVKVAGQPPEDQLRRLRAGISIAEERDPARRVRTAPAQIRVIKEAENPWLEVTLYEGRNRQIRKMFEEIGHHVEKIRRVRYGPLELDVPPGESRPLSQQEVARLKASLTAPQRFRPDGSERQRESRFSRRPERRQDRQAQKGKPDFREKERQPFPKREPRRDGVSRRPQFPRKPFSRRFDRENVAPADRPRRERSENRPPGEKPAFRRSQPQNAAGESRGDSRTARPGRSQWQGKGSAAQNRPGKSRFRPANRPGKSKSRFPKRDRQ